jgi:uncharacterized RDD family membrane protein YckC
MTLEDRHVTPTPEGVSLDLVLAGLGSRFAAYALDVLIQVAVFSLVALIIVLTTANLGSGLLTGGLLALLAILDFFGYFVLCEMLWSGRSVGKRAAGTRVVRVSGSPVGFWSSLLRNTVRLIDMIPIPLYVVGSVLILATTKNQRLGDLMGDTLVIRERLGASTQWRASSFGDAAQWMTPAGALGAWPSTTLGAGLPPWLSHWDVSAVSEQELLLVRTFLANRAGYTPEARSRLSLQLAERLWPSVSGPSAPMDPEQFLEGVALVKAQRGGRG